MIAYALNHPADRLWRMTRAVGLVFILAALGLPILAFGQDPVAIPSPDDPSTFILEVVRAIQGGDWRGVAVLAAVLLTWAAKRYGARAWPWLATKRGGAVLALVLAVAGTLIPALAVGTPFTLKLVLDALLFGFTSIGGWIAVRRIVWGDALDGVSASTQPAPVPPAATLGDLGRESDGPVR